MQGSHYAAALFAVLLAFGAVSFGPSWRRGADVQDFDLTDETSLLTVGSAVLVGAERERRLQQAEELTVQESSETLVPLVPEAVANVAADNSAALLEERADSDKTGVNALANALEGEMAKTRRGIMNIVLIIFVVVAALMGLSMYLYQSKNATKGREPALRGMREVTSSKLESSGSGSTHRSEQLSMGGRPSVTSPPVKYVFSLPVLLDYSTKADTIADLPVTDKNGEGMMHVHLMIPDPVMNEDNPAGPVEYVTISTPDREEELVTCCVVPGPNGWECHIYEGDREFSGYLVSEGHGGEDTFVLYSPSGFSKLLTIRGIASQQRLQIFDGSGRHAAIVEPGTSFSFTKTSQVTCMPSSNLGLVCVSLLGIDRLRCRARQ